MTSSLTRRQVLLGAFLAALQSQLPVFARQADWPTRPVRLVVPGQPGGGSDIFGRLMGASLQQSLGQPVVIENRPGANSLIGNDVVAKAAPDGYTWLISPSSAIAINPIIQPKMPYDTLKDLLPVAQVGAAGILLLAPPQSGLNSLADLVAAVKAKPDMMYGTWGNGSTGHLVMESIIAHYGLKMSHVPFNDSSQVVTALLSNQIPVAFADVSSPVPHVRAGNIAALGCTGAARGPALPDLPTLAEQGFDFKAAGWYGIFAPAGTDVAIVDRMNAQINQALADPAVIARFAELNMPKPALMSASEFGKTVREDVALWQGLARRAGLGAA
ncbi:tripartite tricarboxylate transporter substrate binding protein [Achromobacter sp. GG226]|uniref:Bug family tripartite tricarboxylate transporter substrate binding protein n=1 Tax=Verticiella alkaliphila TaxID=2779529 RepID=UPI001C0AF7FE|nr:tripartite tricarboxylate transporter substrate binding protein [Verticiella sp. GG226]MBU4612332.1 tripartite tricarboxylate transporter substrate binding protein [Verticiella sp. GG226]